ncbi:MAG TPA: Sec-independent protein translocase subunit TatA [Nocardioidaceae bacterium]|jgi:sec-independent protein translocase protein TatA|nr:Sec-independent protein translocase subunit TatA [Nocardioidaceae bacterium]
MPSLGAPEIILIIVVLVLLFGARKLPDLARGSGRALRIFKAETKGLVDDDEKDQAADDARSQQQSQQPPPPQPPQPLPPTPNQTANGTESSDPTRTSRDQQQS